MTDDLTPGEIGRSVARIETALEALREDVKTRHHALNDRLNMVLGPISTHTIQIDSQQRAIDRLDLEMKAVTRQSNLAAGVGATVAILASLLSGWLRGH